MKKENFNSKLFEFINESTCSFTCVNFLKNKLLENGFNELYENEEWELKSGKYFVTRNDASIIAFNIGKNYSTSFNIVCAHSDTPGFNLKPKSEIYEYNYLKLNVMPYGGILNYGWMDRPLSLSGRVIYKEGNSYIKKIIDLEEPVCVIPSEAIHQNDSANTNLDLNTQIDMIPIISLKDEKDIIKNLLKETLNLKSLSMICDYDLFLYSKDIPMFIGKNKEMILSPRIDDLSCTYANYKSFMESSNENNINVMCIFNSEEIGSMTKEGADSSFLIDILKRICACLKIDVSIALRNSLIVSADNSHAVHPNHPTKSDVSNQGYLNEGILIVREQMTTTDSISSSIFKEICKKAKVPYQDYSSRNDMSTGSTLSGLSIKHVSIDSIDVGIAQLAMHSANECCGADDIYYLYKAFKKFYEVSIERELDSIQIK
ncbi:MAG: M18 family aminopeptidase [Bacilli bacterium]|nr:M18 family aminopeptidase [Bacilli bacterium]